jgi:acyl-CoA reductase-like NAD-dependent aldehyde dehydrogenase
MTLALNDPNLRRSACFVGGEWVGTPALAIDNPATGGIVGRVPDFGAKEAEDAVHAAARAFRVADEIEAGMVGINAAILGNEVAPFGGVKESGLGREGGRHGIEEYVEMKYLLIGGLD